MYRYIIWTAILKLDSLDLPTALVAGAARWPFVDVAPGTSSERLTTTKRCRRVRRQPTCRAAPRQPKRRLSVSAWASADRGTAALWASTQDDGPDKGRDRGHFTKPERRYARAPDQGWSRSFLLVRVTLALFHGFWLPFRIPFGTLFMFSAYLFRTSNLNSFLMHLYRFLIPLIM